MAIYRGMRTIATSSRSLTPSSPGGMEPTFFNLHKLETEKKRLLKEMEILKQTQSLKEQRLVQVTKQMARIITLMKSGGSLF